MSYQTDLASLNAWAVAAGGVGNHRSIIAALNDLCRVYGGTRHRFATYALQDISARLGAATDAIEVLDALNVIAGAMGADDDAVTVAEALANILGVIGSEPAITSVTVTGPSSNLLTVSWTDTGAGSVTVQWLSGGAPISGATETTLSTVGRAGQTIVARVTKAGGNTMDSAPKVLANVKPSAFTSGQWTLTDTATGNTLAIDVTALPSAGDQPISSLYYRVNSGPAVLMSGTGTGVRFVSGLTDDVSVNVQIAAESAANVGDQSDLSWSDTKSATPTEPIGSRAYSSGYSSGYS